MVVMTTVEVSVTVLRPTTVVVRTAPDVVVSVVVASIVEAVLTGVATRLQAEEMT